MDATKHTYHVQATSGELVIRHGEAPELFQPQSWAIEGQITAPADFYRTRKGIDGYFTAENTVVSSDRQRKTIRLTRERPDNLVDKVVGTLTPGVEIQELGINSGKSYGPNELGKLLRKYKYLFSNPQEGNEVVAALLTFTGTVNTQTEQAQDTRGQKKNLVETSVRTNAPLGFSLNIPLFKGNAPKSYPIEIVLEASGHNVLCYLESQDIRQGTAESVDEIFDVQLEPFAEAGLTVIEI